MGTMKDNLINSNTRQRIILVSDMPEVEGDKTIKDLSETHSNAVFFTKENIDPSSKVNTGNNIWKGGVNYTRVHGVDQSASTIAIGDTIISLSFDEKTGLIKLVSNGKVKGIRYIGIRNYATDTTMRSDGTATYYLYDDPLAYFASPVNKAALYLQFETRESYADFPQPSQNKIGVTQVKIDSKYLTVNSLSNIQVLDPNDLEIQYFINSAVNEHLPVYKYTFNITDYTGSSENPTENDGQIIIDPKTITNDNDDTYALYQYSEQIQNDDTTHIISRSSGSKYIVINNDKTIYCLAVTSSKLWDSNYTNVNNIVVDLSQSASVERTLFFNINDNDITSDKINNEDLNLRFYDSSNNDITDDLRINEANSKIHIEWDENPLTRKIIISFDAGFSFSEHGYELLTAKITPALTGNQASYITNAEISEPDTYTFDTTNLSYFNKFKPLNFSFKENIIWGVDTNPITAANYTSYNHVNVMSSVPETLKEPDTETPHRIKRYYILLPDILEPEISAYAHNSQGQQDENENLEYGLITKTDVEIPGHSVWVTTSIGDDIEIIRKNKGESASVHH